MTPKPFVKFIPERLPERQAVTIIAGFRCDEGIVVCADTQETIGTAKRNVPKLRFEPCDQYTQQEDNHSNLAAAFCGAGSGPMIDKLIDDAWGAAKSQKSLPRASDAIEASIKKNYKEFGEIYQVGSCPEVQLIYGVKMDGESRLFTAMGPIVNEKFEFDSGGQGHYMADFLAAKMHYRQMNIRQCAILAAFVLFQAKQHVDGCGGESQIAVLRNSGTSGNAWDHRIDKLVELMHVTDDALGDVLLDVADLDLSIEKLSDNLQFQLGDIIGPIREGTRAEMQRQEAPELYNSIDLLGLPLPSGKKKEGE